MKKLRAVAVSPRKCRLHCRNAMFEVLSRSGIEAAICKDRMAIGNTQQSGVGLE